MSSRFRIANEFATVTLTIVESPRGRVVEINAEETGKTIRLDALELEALAGVAHRDLDEFVLRTTQAGIDLLQMAEERPAARSRPASPGQQHVVVGEEEEQW